MRKDSKTGTPIPVQDFAFEQLLCASCEQRFSAWESYAARVFYQRRKFDLRVLPQRYAHIVRGLDYRSLKLYLLSLLWRMGASGLPEFNRVQLGPHLDRIRQMLLHEEPGEAEAYGCTIQIVTQKGTRIPVTRPADRHRVDGLTVQYRLLLDGVLLIWFVGSTAVGPSLQLKSFFLQADGSWGIRVVRRIDVPFLRIELGPD